MFRTVAAFRAGVALAGVLAGVLPAAAQTFPVKPVRLVVAYAAGGSLDAMTRVMAQKMTESMGQTVIVENRPGASANIASEHVARSAPDGYSVVALSSPVHCVNPLLMTGMRFDPAKDLAQVSLAAVIPLVLVVHPSLPVRSVQDMLAFVKRHHGKLAFASSGNGTNPHMAGEQFNILTGAKMPHVPYKGGAPALIDVMSGQIPVMFPLLSDTMGHLASGKVRGIGIAATKRSSFAPDLPTFAEGGLPGFEFYTWLAFDAPAATPKDIIARLSSEMARGLRAPDAAQKYRALGLDIIASTPEYYTSWIKSDCQRIAALIKAVGLKPE